MAKRMRALGWPNLIAARKAYAYNCACRKEARLILELEAAIRNREQLERELDIVSYNLRTALKSPRPG